MAGERGRAPPYGAVILTWGMAEDPLHGRYVRGRLALAGIDLSAPAEVWLDAVYAIWAEAPFEQLEKLAASMIRGAAIARPEEARATWGRLPEHRALAGKLGQGPGLEAGGNAGKAPRSVRRPGAQPR